MSASAAVEKGQSELPAQCGAETRVYVCNNTDCRNRGAESVFSALKTVFEDACPTVQIRRYKCFGACNSGPNVVIPDRRCWLSSVKPDDASAVRQVVEGGEWPVRLRQQTDPDLEEMILGMIDAGLLSRGE